MSFQAWLLFCLTETVLCLTPGPAVLLVVSLSLTRGPRAGLLGSLGILAANTFYFVLSATSVGAVLMASWELFVLVKYVGASYLVWLGVRMIVSASAQSTEAALPSLRRSRRPLALGFLTQGANPKAIVFFSAILPQFIDPMTGIAWQVTVLGVSSILIELAVLATYVTACRKARGWAGSARLAAPLERIGGALLIGAGARLAAIRRD